MESKQEQEVPTALYRHFDSKGVLLYVGISLNHMARLAQHRVASSWFKDISNVTIEWHESRDAALEAERAAIQSEDPLHNIAHAINPLADPPGRLAELAEASRELLTKDIVRFKTSYTIPEAAQALSTTTSAVKWALANGDIPYFSAGFRSVIITGWAIIDYLEALQAGAVSPVTPPRFDDGRGMSAPSNEYLCTNIGATSVQGWADEVRARRESVDLKEAA